MLELALKGNLPLIQVETTDTVNVREVVEHLVGEKPWFLDSVTTAQISKRTEMIFLCEELQDPAELLYRYLSQSEQVLIIVNPEEDCGPAFNAGVVPTPKSMVLELLGNILDKEASELLMPVLGGLTLKDVGEICNITMARDGSLLPEGVMKTRRSYASKLKGIEQVDSHMAFYMQNNHLENWISLNTPSFLNPVDARLVPRGILLYGSSGIGKTMGAKRVAARLKVPLYRLDLSSMMTKWLGEAEGNLRAALGQVDIEQPCVLLVDEVEKIFQQVSENGSTTRMLSQLLWWLQEHTSHVLTVMTTNNMDILPEELYRPGRVDRCLQLRGLTQDWAATMASHLLDTFGPEAEYVSLESVESDISKVLMQGTGGGYISHAEVTQIVYRRIKILGVSPDLTND